MEGLIVLPPVSDRARTGLLNLADYKDLSNVLSRWLGSYRARAASIFPTA
jgi:hypothetical protein